MLSYAHQSLSLWWNGAPQTVAPPTHFNSSPSLKELQKALEQLGAKKIALADDAIKQGPNSLDAKKSKIVGAAYDRLMVLVDAFNHENLKTPAEIKDSTIKLLEDAKTVLLSYLHNESDFDTLMKPRNANRYHANVGVHFAVTGATVVLFFSGPLSILGLISGGASCYSLSKSVRSYFTDSAFLLINLSFISIMTSMRLQAALDRLQPGPNYYEILGVSTSAGQPEISKAYKELAMIYHPDRKQTGNTELFTQINNANATLSDPIPRAAYDKQLALLWQPARATEMAIALRRR